MDDAPHPGGNGPAGDSCDEDDIAFGRIPTFGDAVVAIAMTLPAVTFELPDVADGRLGPVLEPMLPQFVGILIGSAVIGYHWLNHQRCCSKLARVDRRCMILNLMHPGLLPRMPASRHAHQHRILRAPVPRRVSRRGLLAGLPSVAHVLANVSVARWNPDYAKSAWLLVWPAGWAISRAAPSGTSRYLE